MEQEQLVLVQQEVKVVLQYFQQSHQQVEVEEVILLALEHLEDQVVEEVYQDQEQREQEIVHQYHHLKVVMEEQELVLQDMVVEEVEELQKQE